MCQAILHNLFDPFIHRAVVDVLISVLRLRKLRLRQALTIGMQVGLFPLCPEVSGAQ